jgi:hypothetical protein
MYITEGGESIFLGMFWEGLWQADRPADLWVHGLAHSLLDNRQRPNNCVRPWRNRAIHGLGVELLVRAIAPILGCGECERSLLVHRNHTNVQTNICRVEIR